MFLRTTSMPTPRPERLVTFSAVEKPGSKISLTTSWSESVAGLDDAFFPALARIRSLVQAATVVGPLR
jgi:hypothetical protein